MGGRWALDRRTHSLIGSAHVKRRINIGGGERGSGKKEGEYKGEPEKNVCAEGSAFGGIRRTYLRARNFQYTV